MKHSHGHFALRAAARLTIAAIAASSFSINAEESLDSITVTANRMPSENVLAATTVITRSDIERLQITDLPTLLSRQPGVDIATSGGIGKQSSIFMRGTNSSHVLVLVDGVKWYSATAGSPAIQDFPVEQIERVEIVRGPRSGLYGAEAIGGVIQIFTRKGQQGVTPYAKVSYGSHDSKQVSAGVSGGNEQTSYNLSFNHQSTDGISSIKLNNPDKDSYRNNSASLNLDHNFSDTFNVGINYLRAEGFNDYDSGFDSIGRYKEESVQQVIGFKSQLDINDLWQLNVNISESRDQRDDFTYGATNTRHRFASVSNLLELNDNHVVNIGLDYSVDDVDGDTTYNEDSRDNKAAFLSWNGKANKHNWLLSARHDDNEAYGTHNTGTAEWGYLLQEGLKFVASAGTGFKSPTFNDLYHPFGSNPDLKHEESKSFGLGLMGSVENINWELHAYQTKIDDLIVANAPFYIPENVDKAKIKGIEFEVSTVVASLDIAANVSFLKPEDETTGNILARRAQRLANLHADKQWGAWSTGASWKLRGHSFDDAANTTRLGGYGLVDIRAGYQLDRDWQLQASVSNLFDKEYQTVNNYNSLDRTAMLTISYKP